MSAQPTQQTLDDRLEAEIDSEYSAMLAEPTEEGSKAHFATMCRLIHQRSPHRVQQMEMQRRLAIRRAKA